MELFPILTSKELSLLALSCGSVEDHTYKAVCIWLQLKLAQSEKASPQEEFAENSYRQVF